ncbi:hypothetical protein BDR03DRAFT_1077729 [Suillus americanus]|nr:hypothetical protein BDR03DRAFT_1077729 [Suillus americanus]
MASACPVSFPLPFTIFCYMILVATPGSGIRGVLNDNLMATCTLKVWELILC